MEGFELALSIFEGGGAKGGEPARRLHLDQGHLEQRHTSFAFASPQIVEAPIPKEAMTPRNRSSRCEHSTLNLVQASNHGPAMRNEGSESGCGKSSGSAGASVHDYLPGKVPLMT